MYILDSHSFLWTIFEPARLSDAACTIIKNPANDVYVSTVSFWELSLKHGIGKLDLEGVTPDVFPSAAEESGLAILTLDPSVAASFHQLPRDIHKDPFDRLIAWQAIRWGYALISKDGSLDRYREHGLQVVW